MQKYGPLSCYYEWHSSNENKSDIFLMAAKIKIVSTRYNRLDEAVLTSTNNLCFRAVINKMYTPVNCTSTL